MVERKKNAIAIRCHKIGGDGSSKADAFHTGDKLDIVYGAVWKILESEKHILDKCEQLGHGYDQVSFELELLDGTLTAFSYVAGSTYIDHKLSPFCWYKALIVAGAKEHNFPAEYVSKIESWPSIRDTDDERRTKHENLII